MTLAMPDLHPCPECDAIPGEPCQPTSKWDSANGGGFHGVRGLWPHPIVAALADQRRGRVLRVPRVGSPYWANAGAEPSPSRSRRPRA